MSRSARLFVQLSVLGVVVAHDWAGFDAQMDLYGTRKIEDFNAAEPLPGVFAAVAKYTTPKDFIVTTGPPCLYMQVDRTSGMRESNTDDESLGFFDGNTDEEKLSGIRAELMRSRPKLIILDPTEFGEARKRRFRKALWDPFLSDFHYREVSPRIWLRPD